MGTHGVWSERAINTSLLGEYSASALDLWIFLKKNKALLQQKKIPLWAHELNEKEPDKNVYKSY